MFSNQNPSLHGKNALRSYWLAEIVRLREMHWGPLEDASEVRRARTQSTNFSEQILWRALFLATREKLESTQQKWTQGAKIALIGMMIVAVLAGASAALSALGDGTRSVNLLLALAAMLGLHGLTLVFWLFSFTVKSDSGGVWLGHAWLWLTQKLARGPDAALTPQALIELLSRNGALRWVLSSISHSLWTGALLSTLFTLLAVLSARRYGFNWETTLLSPDAFVHFTAAVGWLPAQLGFAMPSEQIVRASNGLHALPESAQALWSQWLIGCVVTYGLIPRTLCLLVSLIVAKKKIAAIRIDETLPAYANLRERLQPTSEKMGIDAPATGLYQPHAQQPLFANDGLNRPLLIGIELPPDAIWPPCIDETPNVGADTTAAIDTAMPTDAATLSAINASLSNGIQDLGIIDTRAQRNALLEHLQQHPPQKLLAVCDSRQTPDRGIISFLADLASLATHTHIALLSDITHGRSPQTDPPKIDPSQISPPQAGPRSGNLSQTSRLQANPPERNAASTTPSDTRTNVWQERLIAANFTADQLHTQFAPALAWLESKQDVTHAGQ